jgi:undecaprenyl-diphosphatase
VKQIISHIDNTYTKKIQSWRFNRLMAFITYGGGPVMISAITATAIIFSLKHYDTVAAITFIWAITACCINGAIKVFLRRGRPNNNHVTRAYKTYSFPSGHAFSSTVTYGLIAFYCLNVLAAPVGALAVILLAVLAFLVGLSRVYVGAHYPTDVLGGFAFGSIALFLILVLVPGA